jgi:hypothetical protein
MNASNIIYLFKYIPCFYFYENGVLQRAHSSPTNFSQTTKMVINNKEASATLISLLKPQTNKKEAS